MEREWNWMPQYTCKNITLTDSPFTDIPDVYYEREDDVSVFGCTIVKFKLSFVYVFFSLEGSHFEQSHSQWWMFLHERIETQIIMKQSGLCFTTWNIPQESIPWVQDFELSTNGYFARAGARMVLDISIRSTSHQNKRSISRWHRWKLTTTRTTASTTSIWFCAFETWNCSNWEESGGGTSGGKF